MQRSSQGIDIVVTEEFHDVLLNQIVNVPEGKFSRRRRHEEENTQMLTSQQLRQCGIHP